MAANTSFVYPNPSLCCCSMASGRTKRRKVECSHPVIHEGRCLLCGRAVDDDHSLPFGFLHPCLRLSHEYADIMREASTRAALGLKKLHLILDLDHTLLHTVRLSNLTPEEEERLVPEVEVGREGRVTMLRPFVREFLREANEMFELTVYTMGGRRYSSRMAKLLDPDGEYFGGRVIAQEDCTVRGRKSLDVVLAEESNVLILDDTAAVWPDHAENLISIEPFYYFSHRSEERGVQPSFIDTEGESEGERDDTVLAMALRFLKEIHQCYFDPNLGLKGGGDVRELVRQVESPSLRHVW